MGVTLGLPCHETVARCAILGSSRNFSSSVLESGKPTQLQVMIEWSHFEFLGIEAVFIIIEEGEGAQWLPVFRFASD